MTGDIELPRQLGLLADALAPALASLRQALDEQPLPVLPAGDMLETIVAHLDRLQEGATRLSDNVNGRLAKVAVDERATQADVMAAADGFAQALDGILDGFAEVQGMAVTDADDAEARDLLAGIYRHLLKETRNWLARLLELLTDTQAALRRLGLPTSGRVQVPVALTLTEAPQIPALLEWCRRHEAEKLAAVRNRSLAGLFWWSIGLLVIYLLF